MRRVGRVLLALALSVPLAAAPAVQAGGSGATWSFREFVPDRDAMCQVAKQWRAEVLAEHPRGTWAPLRFEPTDAQLARLGLPSAEVLLSRRYPRPTLVTADGRFHEVPLSALQSAVQRSAADPAVAAYAGTGCLGIRPGAWLLLLSGGGIGWCTMAHVYGSPGSYDISTAGHCGNTGETATAIAAVGNRGGVTGLVLLDFGKFATSHDGGLGKDWALIDIYSQYQHLVSPTMCFWGGPRGMYTKTGDLAAVEYRRNRAPSVSVTPDPRLAQAVVHYGHGLGIGTGGTPRAGSAISWRSSHFMFFGAVAPGDSGSGVNAIPGDGSAVTDYNEAAGIVTHIWIDPLMRSGLGIMAGTRATQVSGTLANGQIVPYPAPAPGLP